jgi:hypothetical protein
MSGRTVARQALDSGFWKPSSMRVLLATRPGRRQPSGGPGPEDRLQATADWLGAAQDATGDSGVSWGYRLRSGWAPSYPETTGYIIPTFLALADRLADPTYRSRAERAVGFLSGLQFESGAFPGGRADRAAQLPSVFNTAQIIHGLTAWYRATGDELILKIARQAATWLVEVQDEDGAWRRHGYGGYPVTYTAHASCWLAELGVLIDDSRFTAAAGRHLDWVLGQQDPGSGWFERSGFSDADHLARRAVTHTLAYTLWGVLYSGTLLKRADALAAIGMPARALAELVLTTGRLPGVVDAGWSGQASYACLTGNAQMKLVWDRLSEFDPDPRFPAAGARVMELVFAAQSVHDTHPGIRGGIAGSDPVWGAYIPNAFPNWAAKFFADAILAGAPSGG